VKHQRTASTNRALFASENHGAPLVTATAKPGVFKGPETVGPKGVVATNNPTAGPGAIGQGSPDGTQHRTDQKPLPQGPGKAAPLANGEIGHDSGKHALGEPHETGSDAGKHAPGGPQGPGGAFANGAKGGPPAAGAAYGPGSHSPKGTTHGGTPVAQDGSGPHGNNNKDDKDNRPETTEGM